MNEIYLDHNATTPLAPEVAEAMAACQLAEYGNPASQHRAGRRTRQALEEAREGIAVLLGADLQSHQADALIFTSGGTEANNLAILGLGDEQPSRLIISSIEHPSVVGPAEELARRGCELVLAPVTPEGVVEVEWLKSAFTHRSPLTVVSVMLGNNETGVLQPVEQIASVCRAAGSILHTDAVQVAGKLPIGFRLLGVDALTVSAHKFHGPRGVGALLVRHGVKLRPLLHGGFQQAGLRPGTESVALAVGMHAALRLWHRSQGALNIRLSGLRDRFESAILAGFPAAMIHGRQSPRLPHTSNISFPGMNRQALQMALDLAGVACSTGSACASGSTDPSPVLAAMGCSQSALDSSLRFSLGATTSQSEIDQAVERILRVCNELQTPNFPRNSASEGRIKA